MVLHNRCITGPLIILPVKKPPVTLSNFLKRNTLGW